MLSFVLRDIPPTEVGAALDQEGIAVRAGHHCAQPILRRFGYETTVRPSLALYNTREDVDAWPPHCGAFRSGGRRPTAELLYRLLNSDMTSTIVDVMINALTANEDTRADRPR